MTSLDLGGNELSILPDGIFTGLTVELATLNLSDQFNDNDSGTGGDGTPTQTSLTVYLTLVQNGDTVTASIPTGAPANLRVNLAVTGNALSSSPTTIAIDVGTASGTATLLPAAGESLLAAIDTTTPVTLSAAARAHTGMLFDTRVAGGICTRSNALQIALLAHSAVTASACADVTDTMLQDITGELDLSGLSIVALRPGDLAGLTGVTTLNLSDNQLTALPASIFAGLAALTTLNLRDNQLTTVPAGILAPLTTLASLDLSGNQFTTLPNGLFQSLSVDLQTLNLSGQFRNTATPNVETFEVPLTLSLTSDVATVTIATGAPRALTVGLLVAGGAQDGSPTSVDIAAGATTGTATLLPQSGATLVADLDRANPPALPATYSGLTLSTGTTGGICDRSLLVRNALLAAVSATTCEAVTESMLASISAALDMSSMGISALQPADLAGLDSVTALDLSDNSIAELPAGIFDDLDAVTALDLSGNQIAELPAGIFSDLDTLDDLDLTGNPGAPFPFEVTLSIVAPSSVSASIASVGTSAQPQALVPTEAGMMQVQADLPLSIPASASITVFLQTDTGAHYSVAPATPITITDASANSVQIVNVCFEETPTDATTGAGCNGDDPADASTFLGVRLEEGSDLVVDAFPTFDDQIDNQTYNRQVAIDPLQLPQAGFTLPPGTRAPSLTYSLSASASGDQQLASDLPAGLAFSAANRTLTGTPTALGTYGMTYTATDDNGDTASLTFDVEVTEIPVDYDALHAQILSHLAMTVADSAGQAVSDRVDRLFSGQKPRFSTNADASEVEMPLSGRGSIFTLWLQNSATDLSLSGGDFNWSGDVSGTQFGFDWRSGNSEFLIGLMTQNLDGQFNYSSNVAALDSSGYYSTPVDSEHLYFAWMPGGVETSNWLNLWGMLGSGSGSLAMTGPERPDSQRQHRPEHDPPRLLHHAAEQQQLAQPAVARRNDHQQPEGRRRRRHPAGSRSHPPAGGARTLPQGPDSRRPAPAGARRRDRLPLRQHLGQGYRQHQCRRPARRCRQRAGHEAQLQLAQLRCADGLQAAERRRRQQRPPIRRRRLLPLADSGHPVRRARLDGEPATDLGQHRQQRLAAVASRQGRRAGRWRRQHL